MITIVGKLIKYNEQTQVQAQQMYGSDKTERRGRNLKKKIGLEKTEDSEKSKQKQTECSDSIDLEKNKN